MREFGKTRQNQTKWYERIWRNVKVLFAGVSDFVNGYSTRNKKRERKTLFDKYQRPRH